MRSKATSPCREGVVCEWLGFYNIAWFVGALGEKIVELCYLCVVCKATVRLL